MNNPEIQPLPLWPSLLYFGIPAIVAAIIVYGVMPIVATSGFPIFFNYILIYATAPMLALIIASLITYKHVGRTLAWNGICARFRLGKMNGRAWLWVIGLLLFMFLSAASLSFFTRLLTSILSPPAYWPSEIKPGASANMSLPTEYMGQPFARNRWILVLLLGSLTIATFGEEFWWRGYILPRQELVFGNRTWIIHGVMWACFHLFAPWNFIGILPGCLELAYVTQRLKNTWPAIIAHGLANGLLVLTVVVLGILH